MILLASKISLLSEWLAAMQPNGNLTMVVVGLGFFAFGLSRRKSS